MLRKTRESVHPDVDGGYAWVILFSATFISMATMVVTIGGIGTLFVELMKNYPEESKTRISGLSTIQVLVQGVVGYFLGPWVEKLGHRRVAIAGALIGSIGLALSTFVTSLDMLYITFSPSLGISVAFQVVSGIPMTSVYFDKKKSLAMGILMCGYSIGAMVGPVIVVWLSDLGGIRGIFLGFSGVMLQCVWVSALLRPVRYGCRRKERKTIIESIDLENGILNVETSKGERVTVDAKRRTRTSVKMNSDMDKLTKLSPTSEHTQIDHELSKNSESESSFKKICLKGMGLKPCMDPLYAIFICTDLFTHTGHMLPYILLPLKMVSLGTTEETAALYITIIAVVSLCLRLVSGAIGDRAPNKRKYIAAITIVCNGSLSAAFAFVDDTYIMFAYSVGFGLFSAFYLVLKLTAVTDLFGQPVFASFVGHSILMAGIGTLLANSVSAFIIDMTENIRYPFILFGSLQAIGGVVLIVICFLHSRGQTTRLAEIES